MDLNQVQKLISNGETEIVEYKKSIAELEKLGKALCGQLNAKGGYGFTGISDSGKVIGVEVTDSVKMKLTAFKNHFDPWPRMEIEYVSLPDSEKQIIFQVDMT